MTGTRSTRASRAEAATQALANARIEGFIPTAEDLALNQLWIDSQISTQDLIEIHKERLRKVRQNG